VTELLQLPPDPILAVAAYLADDFPAVRHVRPEAQEVDPLGQREHGRFVIQFQPQRDQELFDFFQTGVYDRNREFILTSSPSMDILISSNLERLIYTIAGQDAQKDAELMTQLKEKGVYEITAEMKEGLKDFVGGFATEEEVKETIHDTYQKTGYVMDTHTAVAAHVCAQYRKDTKDEKKCLVASTASPYKFVRNVMTAIDPKYDEMEDFALIDELEKVSGFPIPNAIKEIRDAEVRHTTECDADQMKETVKNILGV